MTAHIYFHHNNIRSLPTNLIYGSKALKSADFEYNRLQAVRFVKPENRLKSKNMHTIDLSRNWRMGQDLNTVFLKLKVPDVKSGRWFIISEIRYGRFLVLQAGHIIAKTPGRWPVESIRKSFEANRVQRKQRTRTFVQSDSRRNERSSERTTKQAIFWWNWWVKRHLWIWRWIIKSYHLKGRHGKMNVRVHSADRMLPSVRRGLIICLYIINVYCF